LSPVVDSQYFLCFLSVQSLTAFLATPIDMPQAGSGPIYHIRYVWLIHLLLGTFHKLGYQHMIIFLHQQILHYNRSCTLIRSLRYRLGILHTLPSNPLYSAVYQDKPRLPAVTQPPTTSPLGGFIPN
jgi:hypothetical protein